MYGCLTDEPIQAKSSRLTVSNKKIKRLLEGICARDANDTARAQINNIPDKSHFYCHYFQ